MLELMIVLAIIATLTAMAIPKFLSALHTQRVELAAHRLVSDLEFASTLARSTGSPVVINFLDKNQVEGNRYEIIGVDDPQKPTEPFIIDLGEKPYQVELSIAPAAITFDIHGHANQTTSWRIEDRGGTFRVVHVNSETGEVTLE